MLSVNVLSASLHSCPQTADEHIEGLFRPTLHRLESVNRRDRTLGRHCTVPCDDFDAANEQGSHM
jgi:hypothetical protein